MGSPDRERVDDGYEPVHIYPVRGCGVVHSGWCPMERGKAMAVEYKTYGLTKEENELYIRDRAKLFWDLAVRYVESKSTVSVGEWCRREGYPRSSAISRMVVELGGIPNPNPRSRSSSAYH